MIKSLKEILNQNKGTNNQTSPEANLNKLNTFKIPQEEITTSEEYRHWLVSELEIKWMTEFNNNPRYKANPVFGETIYISGYFGEKFKGCRAYRFDEISNSKKGIERGLTIFDDYSEKEIEQFGSIANNFEAFLIQEEIKYTRNK